MNRDYSYDEAICKHVDAIAVLLGRRIVGLMTYDSADDQAELVCPESGLNAADAWVVRRIMSALERARP